MLDELKTAKVVVGVKQSIKAVKSDEVKKVFIARDADERVTNNLKEVCEEKTIAIHYVDTMKDLGKACGIDVGAAVAVIIKG